jgi:hypothetical protein
MLEYFYTKKDTIIGEELLESEDSLRGVFERAEFWGRQVLGDDDIFWEYKGATSIVFSQNRDRLQEELTEFCKHKFKEDLSDVVRFNLDMCRDYTNIYPIQKTYKQDTIQNTLGLLDSETITLDHYDKEELEPLEFYHRAYHYQRKNRYWRCSYK